jgi:energy-coupling factor transporter ATP-binding protein EcfA2
LIEYLLVENFTLKFTGDYIFKDLNFICKRGTITILKGGNGSGKTSLLHCICGVIPRYIPGDTEGIIKLFPEQHSLSTSKLYGLLMQDPDKQICFPHLEEELLFGAESLQRDKISFDKDFEMLTGIFPLLASLEIETNTLSFGQKKVLLFSSILLKDPEVFLLDEPSAGLSKEYRDKFFTLLSELKNKGKIIIIAEHETYFDTIADSSISL